MYNFYNAFAQCNIKSIYLIHCRSGNISEVLILRIYRGGQIREFKNIAIFLITIALF